MPKKPEVDCPVTIVLEGASLEVTQVKRYRDDKPRTELLSSEHMMQQDSLVGSNRSRKDLQNIRPDITHQLLLNLLDSPLNKSGKLKLFIHTENNILIDVHPSLRIPRTYKRFAPLMAQLLEKRKINSEGGGKNTLLMRVVENPVDQYLPAGAVKIGLEARSPKLVNIHSYVADLDATKPYVVVIGASSHKDIDNAFVEEWLTISEYPLSAGIVAAKVTTAFENLLEVL